MDKKEQNLRDEYSGLKQRLEDPAIYSSKEYPALARREAELSKVINLFDERLNLTSKLAEAKAMTNINEPELAELAKKVATETAEPIKTSASKLFQPAA